MVSCICNNKIVVIQRSSVELDEDVMVTERGELDLVMKSEATVTITAFNGPLLAEKTHLSLRMPLKSRRQCT